MTDYDSNAAVLHCRRMWLCIGRALRTQAICAAEEGRLEDALRIGSQAAACFWQATGEVDDVLLKDWIDRLERTHD